MASIIPKFQTGNEWAKADEQRRAAYNRANDLFKKANAAKFKVLLSGFESFELSCIDHPAVALGRLLEMVSSGWGVTAGPGRTAQGA